MAEAFKVAVLEQLAITSSELYQCPTGIKALVTFAVAANESTSANTTFTVTVTRSGSSAATYINTRTLPAKKSNLMPEILGMGLEAGDTIDAFAADAGTVNIKLRILESS